jgi:hypothetical protein
MRELSAPDLTQAAGAVPTLPCTGAGCATTPVVHCIQSANPLVCLTTPLISCAIRCTIIP